jgi:transposase
MAYFVGLDVSVKETSVCIVDDAGKIVREARVASDIASSELGWKPDRCRSWLYSVLAEAGLPVICVETRHIRSA